jgi:hypothetical protein
MALFVALILGLQYFGGAYQAEYDGHADEAAHFVSSLLVRDYLAQYPWPAPLPWAMDYYVHYPKVAIGHWPPGYYAIQGLWWLVFPPGRISAMALNVLMGAGVMTLFWALGRRLRVSPLLLGGAGVLMLALPVLQEAVSQVMAELPSLLAAVLFLWALTRVQETPNGRTLTAMWLTLLAAFVVKQTSVGLAVAPVLALALGGTWRRLPRRQLLLWPAVALALVGLLLAWQYGGSLSQVLRWAGVAKTTKLAWSLPQVLDMVGGGVAILAAGGMWIAWRRREPVVVACAAIVLSFALCSYSIRAFRETRHWIALAPPLVLLALAGYRSVAERSRWAPMLLVMVVLSMPHRFYRQTPAGYGALAAQIQQPARMLFSSETGWEEGPWIAVAALREARPGSTIVRATKLLARSDWNSTKYQAKVDSAEEVERTLDGAGIDLVVIHNDPSVGAVRSHHSLLRDMVAASPSWRHCAAAKELVAYCRQKPAIYPRLPLQIELNRMGVGSVSETP